jgi:hypothetical protein
MIWVIWPDFGRIRGFAGAVEAVGVAVHVAGIEMATEVQRRGNDGVSHDLLEHLRRVTGLNHERCRGVSQIVHAEPVGDACPAASGPESLRLHFGSWLPAASETDCRARAPLHRARSQAHCACAPEMPPTPSTADDRHQPQTSDPKASVGLNPTSNTRHTLVMRTLPPDAGGYVVCSLGCGSASPFPPAVLCRAGAWRSWVTVGVRAWRGCSDSSSESSSGFSTACLP